MLFVSLFCCFTSQVNSYGHGVTVSSPNHTFFLGRLEQTVAHTFACNWQQPFLNESAEGKRMTLEIISWSISTKVWDQAGIELATPGYVMLCSHMYNMLVQHTTCRGRCNMKIRNLVVCDTSKGSLYSNKPPLVGEYMLSTLIEFGWSAKVTIPMS